MNMIEQDENSEIGEGALVRTLSERDRDAFLALLAEDAEPNEALHGAFAAHAVLIDQTEFRLLPQQWQAFCERLNEPARIIPALRQLLED